MFGLRQKIVINGISVKLNDYADPILTPPFTINAFLRYREITLRPLRYFERVIILNKRNQKTENTRYFKTSLNPGNTIGQSSKQALNRRRGVLRGRRHYPYRGLGHSFINANI